MKEMPSQPRLTQQGGSRLASKPLSAALRFFPLHYISHITSPPVSCPRMTASLPWWVPRILSPRVPQRGGFCRTLPPDVPDIMATPPRHSPILCKSEAQFHAFYVHSVRLGPGYRATKDSCGQKRTGILPRPALPTMICSQLRSWHTKLTGVGLCELYSFCRLTENEDWYSKSRQTGSLARAHWLLVDSLYIRSRSAWIESLSMDR